MTLLSGLKTNETIEAEKDTLGGTSFIVESGLHDLTIDMAFVGKSTGGAMSLTIHAKNAESTVRNTLWITSGDAKGNLPYFVNKAGKKQFLPGYSIANSLCLLTIGKEISELETEEKVINLYDFDAGKEVPTKVQCLVDLLGQEVTLGMIKQIVDKNVKDNSGNYVPSGETREENEIDKVFRASDGLTVTEVLAEATEPVFKNTWSEKNTGVTRNKAKGAGANASVAGAPTPAPTTSLFAKKAQ